MSEFKPDKLWVRAPSKAVIGDKVHIIGHKHMLHSDSPLWLKFASPNLKKYKNVKTRTTDILFTVDNIFTGPFIVSPIRIGSYGVNTSLKILNALPLTTVKKEVRCKIPDWAINDLFLSGYVKAEGYLSEEAKMCAVTYGNYSTLILKDGAIYNKIMSP